MNGLCLVTYADQGNYCCSVVVPWDAVSALALLGLTVAAVIIAAKRRAK